MTWNAFHHRGDVLRAVVDEAEPPSRRRAPHGPARRRRDLRRRARPGHRAAAALAHPPGRPDRARSLDQPDDLEAAVVAAWRGAAAELAGVRADPRRPARRPGQPRSWATALEQAHRKDVVLLAAMAGLASAADRGRGHGSASGSRSAARDTGSPIAA